MDSMKKVNPRQLNRQIISQMEYNDKNPRYKKSIESKTVFNMLQFIVCQMNQRNGHVLGDSFVQNLNLFSDLQELAMVKYYEQIVEVMSDALTLPNITCAFLEETTTFWQKEMTNYSMEIKNRVFYRQKKKFKSIARKIPSYGSSTLQSRIMEIFCQHIANPEVDIKQLFGGMIGKSHWIFKEIKRCKQMDRLLSNDLLSAINGKNIYSKRIQSLHFDNKAVTPSPAGEAYCIWNLGQKHLEFTVLSDTNTKLKTKIDSSNLQSLEFNIYRNTRTVQGITFNLSTSLNLISDEDEANQNHCNQTDNVRIIKKVTITLSEPLDAIELKGVCSDTFHMEVGVNMIDNNNFELKGILWDGTGDRIMSTPYGQDQSVNIDLNANMTVRKVPRTDKELSEFFEPSVSINAGLENFTDINSNTPITTAPVAESAQITIDVSGNHSEVKHAERVIEACKRHIEPKKGGTKKTPRTKRKQIIIDKSDSVFVVPTTDISLVTSPPQKKKKKPIIIEDVPIDVENYRSIKQESCSSREMTTRCASTNVKKNAKQQPKKATRKSTLVEDESYAPKNQRQSTATTNRVTRFTRSTLAKIANPPLEPSPKEQKVAGIPANRRKDTTNQSVVPSKRLRSPSFDSDDLDFGDSSEPKNYGQQFESLLTGPSSFRGKVVKDAKNLQQKYSKEFKQNKSIIDPFNIFSDDST